MTPSIRVVPPPSFTLYFLYTVALAFGAFIVYLYFNSTSGLPAEKAHEQLSGVLAILCLAGFFVGLVVWAVHRRSVTLSDTELTIRAGFYTRKLKRSSLRMESGIVTSLMEQRTVAPRWRTNGIRVPGFQAGWFRLVNGEKALVLLTDPRLVTYIKTSEGFSLLISTSDLLRALGEPAPENGKLATDR